MRIYCSQKIEEMKIIQKLRSRPHGIELSTLLPEDDATSTEIKAVCTLFDL